MGSIRDGVEDIDYSKYDQNYVNFHPNPESWSLPTYGLYGGPGYTGGVFGGDDYTQPGVDALDGYCQVVFLT